MGIAIENMPDITQKRFCCKAEELCALVDAFNNPLVGCCWDTGHGMISGDDQYEALTLLGHRVKALHIDDNYGTARDVHLLPYEGLIDWSRVLRALHEIGYDHDFAFEHALNPTPHAVMPVSYTHLLPVLQCSWFSEKTKTMQLLRGRVSRARSGNSRPAV